MKSGACSAKHGRSPSGICEAKDTKRNGVLRVTAYGRVLPKGKARVMERDLERDVNVYAVLKVCQYLQKR